MRLFGKRDGSDEAITWRTEKRRLGDLVDWEKNPRQMTEKQADDLARSIGKFGYVEEIVVNADGRSLIGGHRRKDVILARALMEPDAMVDMRIPSRELTEDEREELAIRLNRNTGDWDFDGLANDFEVSSLVEWGFDADELGVKFTDTAPSTDGGYVPSAEEADALQKEWRVKRGDLWIVGSHRLLCGDCTKPEDVGRLFAAEKAALLATDPPYGVNYGDIQNSRERAAKKKRGEPANDYAYEGIENDDLDGEALQSFLESMLRAALPHLIENPAFYVWHAPLTQGVFFAAAAAAAEILIHRQIIWVKPSLILGRGDYHWRHELCFYGWIRGRRCRWLGDRKQDTVWEIGREDETEHQIGKAHV